MFFFVVFFPPTQASEFMLCPPSTMMQGLYHNGYSWKNCTGGNVSKRTNLFRIPGDWNHFFLVACIQNFGQYQDFGC